MKSRRAVSSTILNNKALTGFEKSVYLATLKIPRGEVRPYKWIARDIGHPDSSRAVGNALNKNPYYGIVPCHRVVRSDGTLGGFAKGAGMKRRLLKREGVDPVRDYRKTRVSNGVDL